jgi:hypothetical protein
VGASNESRRCRGIASRPSAISAAPVTYRNRPILTVSYPRSGTLSKSKAARKSQAKSPVERDRGWGVSVLLLFSAIAVTVVMAIAVGANLALGRIIHWNILSVFAIIGFVFLAIGRKYKTI